MRKFSLMLIFLLGLSASAFAADEAIDFGGYGGFSLGLQYLNVSDLNEMIDDAGFTELSPWRPYIGIHGHGIIFERLLVGLRGGAMRSTGSGDGVDMSFHSGWGQLEFGYLLMNNRYGLFAPLIGIGGFGFTLDFDGPVHAMGLGEEPVEDPRTGEVTNRGEVLDDLKMSRGGAHSFIGLTYQYPFRFAGDEHGFAMFVTGATMGATLQMIDSRWMDEDGDAISGGPDLAFHSFYLVVEIAFGGGAILDE